MSLLKQAVEAQVPLIYCTIKDTLFMQEIFEYILGTYPQEFEFKPGYEKKKFDKEKSKLFIAIFRPDKDISSLNLRGLHDNLQEAGRSMILCNAHKAHPQCFDIGEVFTPKPMLEGLIQSLLKDKDLAKEVMPALGGCSVKEANELIRLSTAETGELTSAGISSTRKKVFRGPQGLTQVEAKQLFYIPDERLKKYVDREKYFFLNETDTRLLPRGLLLAGPPGVGKTEGAKYIAGKFGVPLYRIDLAGAKNKWHGQTEEHIASSLAKVDQEEPCIVLIDEVEKLLSTSDIGYGGSVTASVLSQFLWWLAGHSTRVLTIMTTNDETKLPPELIRKGRLDEKLDLQGLLHDDAVKFAQSLLGTFSSLNMPPMLFQKEINNALSKLPATQSKRFPHASVTTAVYDIVKNYKLSEITPQDHTKNFQPLGKNIVKLGAIS